MQRVIYIDVLFITNAVTGYFLLRAVLAICALKAKIWRYIVAFVLSGLASFVIFAQEMPQGLLWVYKIITAGIICAVCCESKNIRIFFKVLLWYLGLNFALAGVVFGVIYYFAPKNIVYSNMTVYFNISPIVLLACSAVVYLVSLALSYFFAKPSENVLVEVQFLIFDKYVNCTALLDSGFLVRDSLCGNEIIMLSLPMLKPILPSQAVKAVERFFGAVDAPYGVYPVCIKTVSGEKAFPCIKISNVSIKAGLKITRPIRCAAAFTQENLSAGEFSGLISVKTAGELL